MELTILHMIVFLWLYTLTMGVLLWGIYSSIMDAKNCIYESIAELKKATQQERERWMLVEQSLTIKYLSLQQTPDILQVPTLSKQFELYH